MRALLFRQRFVAPILEGRKTQTRRLPKHDCGSFLLVAAPGPYNPPCELYCPRCKANRVPRWRAELQAEVQAVVRPLFAAPDFCRSDVNHGRMERLRDHLAPLRAGFAGGAAPAPVIGYGCKTCRVTVPAAFAVVRCAARRVERLGEISEADALTDGLCSRDDFLAGFAEINGLGAMTPGSAGPDEIAVEDLAVEVYAIPLVRVPEAPPWPA